VTEGERWTRAELERLLAGRFSPRAVQRFLHASFARSAEVRARRPELARQSRRWLAAGALAYAAVPAGRRPGAAAWWATTAVMLDWHLGMFETPEGEPRPLGPADAATLTRAWLVPIAARRPTATVCAIGGITDVLDGRLARATRPTRAGRDLEGFVDACFVAAALRGLANEGRLPRAVVAAETARVAAGFAYALVAYFARARRPEDDLLHAARATTALRLGGVALAAAGARRAGGALVASGCALSVALGARAASRARSAIPAA
jgi:phosphatidylglycerophosphate synthase